MDCYIAFIGVIFSRKPSSARDNFATSEVLGLTFVTAAGSALVVAGSALILAFDVVAQPQLY